MPTYAIGDVQGCYQSLLRLLDKIHYSDSDTLWFTGDLVNRGPQSLETLRFIKSLSNPAIVVLGNHDLGMLAVLRGAYPYDEKRYTFHDILDAPDKEALLNWLESKPLVHHSDSLEFTLVHAGFHPAFDLNLALSLSRELESTLQSKDKFLFYPHLFGNTPDFWDPKLQGMERLRFIVNAFTRLRFCNEVGKMEFKTKESAENPPEGYLPWYEIPHRKSKNLRIIFGHWAALQGKCHEPNVFALDTGCVWGNALTALCLESNQRFSVSCDNVFGKSI